MPLPALRLPPALRAACTGLALAASLSAPAHALTVFDGAAGLPAAQGWMTLSLGAPGSGSTGGGSYLLDSTAPGVDTFGHARLSPVALDPVAGWQADLRLRIVDEQHAHADRAGFSVLFVGSQPQASIEIAFHEDRVFAYAYQGGSFVQGVGAAVDTTDQLHDYRLSVANQQFSLSRGGQLLFSGSLQDYTPQGLPYTLPGFLFFGDNTSSGAARVELAAITLLSPVPEPASAALLLAGLLLLGTRLQRPRHQP